FRLFCERPAEQASTLVVVESAELATAGSLLLVRLVASHFLWKMVRRVVGTLVEVGSGRLSPAAFAALLEGPAPHPTKRGAGLPGQGAPPPRGPSPGRVLPPGPPPLPPPAPAVPVAEEP